MVTGQLAVPLHHVEGVGDIAVLRPRDCAGCRWPESRVMEHTVHGPLPVVGQVVAHVEKCPTCRGFGDGPGPIDENCHACRGSGWVRDQYVRVTEVLPIVDTEEVTWEFTGYPCVVRLKNCRCAVYRRERSPHGGPYYVDGDYFDLPGAVPGGVALIVEPAACPECGYDKRFHAGQDQCRACFPYPVSAPSAPYAESEEGGSGVVG